ncbi:helix-turn-helix transcriptional regulator [Moheibacter lacus]|jgi:transcriptional regulator with XRE-family HTH domain|uniref:Helix-turn-helix transcriptional regulator n=1 Tax=Moheibacter lacus TaxID=2745851 RepID=A0A838ZTS8_9FLAO|nr:helix-turn-helix transcriptional regulator [Moheibacter lacus]MBA5630372.1 helix-turn-helix transcriptional regulator [Moheibacter lacus]
MANNDINRLRVVLAEKGLTNKWLAERMKKNPTTISRWCNNDMQPSLETLLDIANALQVDIKDLLWSSKK